MSKDDDIKLISRKRLILELFLLFFSGCACALALPGINISVLAWVSLIPLFVFSIRTTLLRSLVNGYVWGLGYAGVGFFWIREIEPILPLPLTLYIAFFSAIWALGVNKLYSLIFIPLDVEMQGYDKTEEYLSKLHNNKKEILLALLSSMLWCSLEWVRATMFTGFPWNNLATTQWQNLPIIQIAEYTSFYGVSFLIVFMNIALYFSFKAWKRGFLLGRYRRSMAFFLAIFLILVNFYIGSRTISSTKEKFDSPVLITVIQGNVPQSRAATMNQVTYAMSQYYRLTKEAIQAINTESAKVLRKLSDSSEISSRVEALWLRGRSDLIVWPETAVPVAYEYPARIVADYRFMVKELLNSARAPFLIGTLDTKDKKEFDIDYNAAFMIRKNKGITERYYKRHIVPFGEYVPLAEYMPWLVDYIGMGRGLTPGDSSKPIEIREGVYAGVSICFEDVFPYITRDQVLNGANMLLTITNDAWYPNSDEPEQHLANSIFRAIETRLPYVRCGNNSTSCYISPYGQILDSVSKKFDLKLKRELPAPELKEEGFATFSVLLPKEVERTFYVKYGDIFVYICNLLVVISFVFVFIRWNNKKQRYLASFKA
jgi:apolipoprotein N-acyltransferase